MSKKPLESSIDQAKAKIEVMSTKPLLIHRLVLSLQIISIASSRRVEKSNQRDEATECTYSVCSKDCKTNAKLYRIGKVIMLVKFLELDMHDCSVSN